VRRAFERLLKPDFEVGDMAVLHFHPEGIVNALARRGIRTKWLAGHDINKYELWRIT
jgi:hypothetical protein